MNKCHSNCFTLNKLIKFLNVNKSIKIIIYKMFKFCIKSFLISRICYISFILLVFRYKFVTKYDLSSDIVASIETNNENKHISIMEKQILSLLSHFSSYDAVMFVHISKEKYTNDSIFAFFPLFPYLMNGLSKVFSVLGFGNPYTPYLISGFLLSNFLCLINTILIASLIYKLTESRLKSKISALLFLCNPGAVFYISIYSENLCFTLQILFILLLISPSTHNSKILPLSVLILGLLTTRSNCLFMCAFFVIPCFLAIFEKKKLHELFDYKSLSFNLSVFIKLVRNKVEIVGKYIVLCLHAYMVFLWMTKFQPKQEICSKVKHGINKNGTKFDQFEKFCLHPIESKINNIYSYIQTEYWNVGLLKQISINTLDRVILSLPMNILAGYVVYKAINYFEFGYLIRKFHLVKFLLKNKYFISLREKKSNKVNIKEYVRPDYEDDIRLNSFVLGGLIHLLFMMFVLIFMAHPQINNRLLPGCPILYFFLSDDIILFLKSGKIYSRGLLIIIFYISFSLLSCIMQVGSYGFA